MFLALFFGLLGSVGAILGAALLLVFPDALRQKLLPCPLSYATGTLLGAAFLGMLPKSLELARPLSITGTVTAGIIAFFILEKLVIWRHCHDETCVSLLFQPPALFTLPWPTWYPDYIAAAAPWQSSAKRC
jgi:zinc and cadmium transporter